MYQLYTLVKCTDCNKCINFCNKCTAFVKCINCNKFIDCWGINIQLTHLLQLTNLHWHHYHQRPYFTLGFTLGVVYSVSLDKCIMTYIHHYRIIQSIFTALKIPRDRLFIPPLWQASLKKQNKNTTKKMAYSGDFHISI